MIEQKQKLNDLIEFLPVINSACGFSQLNMALSKYTAILNFVNSYNEEFKRATSLYYSDISQIRDNIQESLYSPTQREKDVAFTNARNELETDIKALCILIQVQTHSSQEILFSI